MSRIDRNDIDARLNQSTDSLRCIGADTNRRAYSQVPLRILARIRKLFSLLDILEGNQSLQVSFRIGNKQFLDFVRQQNFFSFLKINILPGSNEVLAGHDVRDFRVKFRFNAKIPVCNNSFELPVGASCKFRSPYYRNPGNGMAKHEVKRILHRRILIKGKRIANDAALISLDLCHFPCLLFNGQVFMDNANAACTRQGNSKSGFGHRIHRGAYQGYFQRNCFRKSAFRSCFFWKNAGISRDKKNIVKRQRFIENLLHRQSKGLIGWLQNQFCQFTKSEHRMTMLIAVNIRRINEVFKICIELTLLLKSSTVRE